MSSPASPPALRRELGLFGAMMMGMGSIVGTGVFVSLGLAAGVAGPAVLLAVAIAALVATCNGLSSAQLAASHPVSGGTYEYGYRYATPTLGFVAGWTFLCAKSASAATAALGFAGYLLEFAKPGLQAAGMAAPGWGRIVVALMTVAILTLVTLRGVRASSQVNIAIVMISLGSLAFFVVAGLPAAFAAGTTHLTPFFKAGSGSSQGPLRSVLEASALMFVAYTGYGRIATLGEEVREPRRTIPRAIIATLLAAMALYISVAAVAVMAVGADVYAGATDAGNAPLEALARGFAGPAGATVLAIGAMAAMLGVLLNLVLGLSRVLLAMGRRGDMPAATARIDATGGTPTIAVPVMGAVIALLTLIGNVKTTWSFSAFTVLIYYAITNYCALRLQAGERLFPAWISAAGLAICLALAWFVEVRVWIAGLGLILAGLVWRKVMRRAG